MLAKIKLFRSVAAILLLSLFLMNGCGEKKVDDANTQLSGETTSIGDLDIGLPIYPGAEQDPEQPPINTPHMKNIKLLTSDSFDDVVKWYSQKLGEFDVEHQEKGYQALWNRDAADGFWEAATISTILAPPGKVAITLVKSKTGK